MSSLVLHHLYPSLRTDYSKLDAAFWAVFYFFEKILIVYISVHYHYRSDRGRIERSKKLINALATLYDTSVARHSLYGDKFQNQDIIIRDAVAAGRSNRRDALKFFQRIGGASGKVLSAFGNMLGSGEKSHWLKPGSTYAIVEHALEKPASAKALAQRIWLSFVPRGESALTKAYIAGAFNLDQKEEAEKCLTAIDENENGDVRLTEMEPMLVEAGKTRLNIYRNMQEIDHAINTLDWILFIWIAIFMLFVILVGYVPLLMSLKELFGFIGLGVGVAIKSVVSDFILGCVFIFFKHPYDIGDRIDLYNRTEAASVGVIVKQISLLYCVFERTDTGATVQFPNSHLSLKRVENLSRSGQGKEKLTMTLNVNTSFKDLEYLRDEMKSFLADPVNSRDYKPNVALRVKSINELDKMDVTMTVTHKSNWSNDSLKGARSSRLYCRLIEIARMVPLYRPDGGSAMLGDEGKPNYLVVVSEEEATAKRNAEKTKFLKKRHDFEAVNVTGLDDAASKKRAAALKGAETTAYQGIASIPAAMAGRHAERPAGKVFGQANTVPAMTTGAQFHDIQLQNDIRPRVESQGFSSERPVYETGFASHGVEQAGSREASASRQMEQQQ